MRIGVVLATTMLFATACGGGSQLPSDPVEALTAASERLTEQGPLDVTLESTTTAEGVSFVFRGEGVMDIATRRGHLTFSGESSHPQATFSGESCELIYDGSIVYGRLPDGIPAPLADELGIDTSAAWLRGPLEEDDDILFSSAQGDDVVSYLRSVSDDVEVVGTEDVEGVRTTHYRAAVSPERMAEQAGADDASTAGIFSEPPVIDAWVDDDGLPRRVTTRAELQERTIDGRWSLTPHEGPFEISPPSEDITAPVESAGIVHGACLSGGSGFAPGGSATNSSETAADRAAQSSLYNAVTAAKTIYTDNETYEDATPEALGRAAPSLTFVAGESTGPRTVSVGIVGPDEFRAAALSDSGTCFGIRDVIAEGITFAQGTVDACTADTFSPAAYTNAWTS